MNVYDKLEFYYGLFSQQTIGPAKFRIYIPEKRRYYAYSYSVRCWNSHSHGFPKPKCSGDFNVKLPNCDYIYTLVIDDELKELLKNEGY